MQLFIVRFRAISLALLALFALVFSSDAQSLTVQVGSTAPPPVPVVNHGDSWRYHKGTNAAVGGWQTAPDGGLGPLWLTGNGGIGYADNTPETVNCQTLLADMRNLYSTFYMRREFQIASQVDTNAHLRLTMDFDDAFVAYLDGVEIRRGGTFTGTVNVEP